MNDILNKTAESVRLLQGRDRVRPVTVGFTHGYSHWTPSGSRRVSYYPTCSRTDAQKTTVKVRLQVGLFCGKYDPEGVLM